VSGYLLVGGGSALFASTGVVSAVAFAGGVAPMELAALRSYIAGLILLPFLLVAARRLRRADVLPIVLFALVGIVLAQGFYYGAISRMDIAVALVIVYTGPLLVAAYQRVFHAERLPLVGYLAMALAVAGVAIAVLAGAGGVGAISLLGVGFALLTAVCFAGQAILGARQPTTAKLQDRAGVVLQTAIPRFGQMQHEQIVISGWSLHPHQPATGQAHPFHIGQPARVLLGNVAPPADPAVGHTGDRKPMARMGPDLDRAVDQLIQMLGQPTAIAVGWQRHKPLPTRRQLQQQAVGRPALTVDLQDDRRQRQKALLIVEVGRAHRQLGGLQRIGQGHRLQRGQHNLPTKRCHPSRSQRLALLLDLQAFELAHILTQQVRARGPAGQ